MISFEMRPPRELENPTTQHQREVVLLLEKIGFVVMSSRSSPGFLEWVLLPQFAGSRCIGLVKSSSRPGIPWQRIFAMRCL